MCYLPRSKVIQFFDLNKVAIFSDSLSVLKRLSTNGLKSDNHPIIGDILRILNEIIILENRKVFSFGYRVMSVFQRTMLPMSWPKILFIMMKFLIIK